MKVILDCLKKKGPKDIFLLVRYSYVEYSYIEVLLYLYALHFSGAKTDQ
jgi:hypothetical protein